MGYYVDVRFDNDYTFYYNMAAEVNKNVEKVVGQAINNRPISESAQRYIDSMYAGHVGKTGPSNYGQMGLYNSSLGTAEYMNALDMQGITAIVNRQMAEEILVRAAYYCPKDTGNLVSSGRIEDLPDGSCRIFFDCPYAWYVHEFVWVQHIPPTCAKFLTLAIQEVETSYGLWGENNDFS